MLKCSVGMTWSYVSHEPLIHKESLNHYFIVVGETEVNV